MSLFETQGIKQTPNRNNNNTNTNTKTPPTSTPKPTNPTNINRNKQTKNNPNPVQGRTGETNSKHAEKKTHNKSRFATRRALRWFETHGAGEKLDY
jgi:hypothetical protein